MSDSYSFSLYVQRALNSLRWLLSQQNRNGSWGNNDVDRIRWTANAVQTLSLLGITAGNSNRMKRAISWLKSISQQAEEWFLRIPALHAAGEIEWLKKHNDYDHLIELFQRDQIGKLPFKVALALDLLSINIDVPNVELIRGYILGTLRDEGNELCSFGGNTNYTTLYATFLKILNRTEDRDIIQKVISWIRVRAIEKASGRHICWEESYGKTAYVSINLIELESMFPGAKTLAKKALGYFQPSSFGKIPPDNIPAIESRSSIYTTILFIRTVATFLKRDPLLCQEALPSLVGACVTARSPWKLILLNYMPLGLYVIACLTMLSLLYVFMGTNFTLSVAASLCAAAIFSAHILFRFRRSRPKMSDGGTQ